MSVYGANLGFPRIGRHRELKFALEKFWKGDLSEQELLATAKLLRAKHWQIQTTAGISAPPSNDFSLYDHVLDMAVMLGAVPARFGASAEAVSLATYFAMARGSKDAPALEMTKWFDTNYHYVVPEFEPGASYSLCSDKALAEYLEAKALGIETRPVLLGPVSFVLLGKVTGEGLTKADVLRAILPLYIELLSRLGKAGVEWVQLDEPCLTLDLDADAERMYRESFKALEGERSLPKLMLTTYFGDLEANLPLALELGTAGLHVDLVRAPKQLDQLILLAPKHLRLSLGLIDGRNVWITDLRRACSLAERAVAVFGKDCLEIAPSCSLLHIPFDLELETRLDSDLRSWMAFAKQKLEEVKLLATAIEGDKRAALLLRDNALVIAGRRCSPRIHLPEVAQRLTDVDEAMRSRENPHPIRKKKQQDELNLPLLPTTTIGSFPQTAEVRKMCAAFRSGNLDAAAYDSFLEEETTRCIRFQERIGIDVLVHGEFERNDMVEYFEEQLDGFVFSEGGWVQSYGSRCVKPPIIFGDVQRPHPMTLRWTKYACSLTCLPVKGMLTGPVTILQWSFVRDDQPRSQTCRQIALAIRDEVADLESAGARIIQIDEPAIREGLPLRRADWGDYLDWSVNAFRLASSGVEDETQIHTHMCYSEFNDIIDSIVKIDADVISIECPRSRMELLDAFDRVRYPNEIGPGVYDIHSPRVPERSELETLLRKALEVLSPEQLWVNPDCGLKTRGWTEVEQALVKMVEATKGMRAALAQVV